MGLLAVVISYLIGSIPVGYLLGRAKGVDIRRHGSGNIGATNVWRTLGPAAGATALVLDVGKGLVAVLLGRYIGGDNLALACGLAVIAGHSWSIFLGFRGGKIIATSLGVFLALAPVAALLALGVWLVVVILSRYVSLGSIVAAITMPFLMVALRQPWSYVLFSLVAAAIAVYKHLPNIRRLLAGTEPKIR